MRRIEAFESWLPKQSEETIAVVGHSQYFKAMLGLPYKFGNCDVWRVTYDPNVVGSGTVEDEGKEKLRGGWSGLQNLYGCEE